jgi:hypothetical protein
MKPALTLALSLLLALALACACACSGRSSRAGADATVVGTVLDVRNGAPVSGVRLEGPQGARAVSKDDGRFEMTGLRAGDSGEIVGRSDDGRTGSLILQSLPAGRLEVVLYLRRP